jgi:hypothetical protein
LTPPFVGFSVVIDHAPVDAEPPILAPVKVKAVGDALWHTASGPPGVTVAGLLQGFAKANRENPLSPVLFAMVEDPATWVPSRVHAPPPSGRLSIRTVPSNVPAELNPVPVSSSA